MFAQYFGHYLLNNGLITASDLNKVLGMLKDTKVKLGVLAIHRGFLNADQAEEIHQEQTRADKRFGDIAVEHGYLTKAQADQLAAGQKPAHLALGQAMIDLGLLSYEQLASALHDYQTAYEITDEQLERMTRDDVEAILDALLLKGSLAANGDWSNYIRLFAKNCVRFLGGDFRLENRSDEAPESYEWMVYQPILNPDRGISRRTAIAGSKNAFLQLASFFAQEKVNEIELMEAAVGEFLNLHNGIYLVNLSNGGVELDLKPQTFLRGTSPVEAGLTPNGKAVIRAVGAACEFDLILENLSDMLAR